MDRLSSSAVKMTNREFFRMREENALRRIPGVRELQRATPEQRGAVEIKYPDAIFALQIISNPFVNDREVGAIRMDAYAAILDGEAIADVRYKYDRQMRMMALILDYDRLCRDAISKGADLQALYEIPAKEKIGRAKYIESDRYANVYADIGKEMEAQIAAVVEKAGADV